MGGWPEGWVGGRTVPEESSQGRVLETRWVVGGSTLQCPRERREEFRIQGLPYGHPGLKFI
jgi:hypothetical protein